VAVSGLEMTQNSVRMSWSWQEMDTRLREIMRGIHNRCVKYAPQTACDKTNYVDGANIAGYVKVADAMLAYGVM
jgi:glutamate dehydrogenase (NADP+)